MRNAWRIGCVLALATAAGCERDAGATTSPIEAEPVIEPSGLAQESAGLGADVEPSDVARDDALRSEIAEAPAPSESAGKPAGTTDELADEPLDPSVPRAMEFGRGGATEGDLWPRGDANEDEGRGAFIVRRGEAYWTGARDEAASEPAAEPTEAEVRMAEIEARAAEAEARAAEAEARAVAAEESALAAQEAAAAAREERAVTQPGGATIIGVPDEVLRDSTTQRRGVASGGLDRRAAPRDDDPRAPGAGQRGVGVEPGAGQRGVGVEPGLGQRGVGVEPGLGQRGVGVQPGLGGGGASPRADQPASDPGLGQRGVTIEPGMGQRGVGQTPGAGGGF